MNILIFSPVPRQSRRGNEITAIRWRQHLRALGHRVTLASDRSVVEAGNPELLIALNAEKSGAVVTRFRSRFPNRPIWVMLTGTDIYRQRLTPVTQRSMDLATRLIALQDQAFRRIPKANLDKLVVVKQSAVAPAKTVAPLKRCFEVSLIGHLRPVKDPFRGPLALQQLPADSKIILNHYGEALSDAMAQRASRLSQSVNRYHWRASLRHSEVLKRLSRSRATLVSSRSEGGAAVISEAIACRVPVLATRVDGNLGILGEDYCGYFPVGDTDALAELLTRLERDSAFQRLLKQQVEVLGPTVDPQREQEAIARLLR